MGKLDDYTTHDVTLRIRFNPTTLTMHGLTNPVINIPDPPVIFKPAHGDYINSLNPTVIWLNDEIADGGGAILLENKPVPGNIGNILCKSDFLTASAAENEWEIPVKLSHGSKYYLIIWSYFQNKFVEGRWMGSV